MKDFNAKIGARKWNSLVDRFQLGITNERELNYVIQETQYGLSYQKKKF